MVWGATCVRMAVTEALKEMRRERAQVERRS